MKIAIITIVDYFNHGNRLQNYALQEKIKEIYPDAEIDTLGVFAKRGLYSLIKFSMLFKFLPVIKRIKRAKELTINTQSLIHMDKLSKKNLSKFSNYDAFVIGSDQVWNPTFLDYPSLMFALFADIEHCMSYSASFGVVSIPKGKLLTYKNGLNHLKYISVRENEASKLVDEILGSEKNTPVVLDPTLLLKKEDWLKYRVKFDKKPEKYILTYFVAPKSWQKKYVKNLSKKTGFKVVNCNNFFDKCFCNTCAEFVDLILDAEVVCTNSFHGHAMSIVLQKPFISFSSKKKTNSRISSLLKNLDLENRQSNKLKDEDLFRLDYEPVNKRLDAEREKSFNFLKNSLDSIIGNKQK